MDVAALEALVTALVALVTVFVALVTVLVPLVNAAEAEDTALVTEALEPEDPAVAFAPVAAAPVQPAVVG